jgi:hypothetical protein
LEKKSVAGDPSYSAVKEQLITEIKAFFKRQEKL